MYRMRRYLRLPTCRTMQVGEWNLPPPATRARNLRRRRVTSYQCLLLTALISTTVSSPVSIRKEYRGLSIPNPRGNQLSARRGEGGSTDGSNANFHCYRL